MYGVNLSGAEFGSKTGKYGWDYIYPSAAGIRYYAEKGVDFIRLPFLWERVQPVLGGPLNTAEIDRIHAVLTSAEANGIKVILDVHNYASYSNAKLGSAGLPITAFQDVWGKLAGAFGSSPALMGYGLMNEPVGMGSSTVWPQAAQAAIDSIRAVDGKTAIYVGGDGWGGAQSWQAINSGLVILKDPSGNIVYEAHQYFDHDNSGTYQRGYDAEGAYAMIGVDRLQPFIQWLETNHLKGFIGEYAVPDTDPRWQTVMDNFLSELDAHGISSAYWGAGPWWGDYPLSIEPNAGVDSAQMDTLEKHIAAAQAAEAAVIALRAITDLTGTIADDTLQMGAGHVRVFGGDGNDTLRGSTHDDMMQGDAGNDRVSGKEGNDTVNGGDGDDQLWGDQGNDIVIGGAGGDRLWGGDGDDVLYGDDCADLLRGELGDDALHGGAGNDMLWGGDGNDVLYGEDGDDTLAGDNGNDILYGGTGNDTLESGTGNDTLHGDAGNDILRGGSGDNALYGDAGNDKLYGGLGNDVLYGGAGSDVLYGEGGADLFVFLPGDSGIDTIADFSVQGGDRLDISALLQSFNPLTQSIADFVQITASGRNSVLSVDSDGNGDYFVAIATLLNVTGLTDEAALAASGALVI